MEVRWRAGTGLWLASAALAALVAFAILAAGDGVEGRPISSDDVITALAIGGALFAGWLVFGLLSTYLARRAMAGWSGPGLDVTGRFTTGPGAVPQDPRAFAVGVASGSGVSSRFDRFTDRARRVLTLAQDEAQRFDHGYIGTEHILLGLIREEHGVAAQVLAHMGVELPRVRTAVEFIIGRGVRPPPVGVGLTPRGKRVIELAIDESRRMGHDYIGTEHLLLGLVREGEGIAAGVLESLGVNLDLVRHEVIRVLSPDSPGESPDA